MPSTFKRAILLFIAPLIVLSLASCAVVPLFHVDVITAEFDFGGSFTGITVTFRATIDNADSYTWDFGDGAQGFGQIVQHFYANTGTYKITVKISQDGRTYTFSETVVINTQFGTPGPPPAVTYTKMYWTDNTNVRRADLDGFNIETLITGLDFPFRIALGIE